MHRVNFGYTLLARLRDGCVETAAALLREYDADHARLPFERTATTHFATVTIIPAQTYNDEPLPATLMVATSFSGPARIHVLELVRELGAPLRALFACCEDFTAECNDSELVAFIEAHRHADAFYSGMQHLAREDVLQHRQLRDAIEEFLDAQTQLPEDPIAVRELIQKHVRTRADLAWAMQSYKPPLSAWFALHWRSLIVLGVAALLLAMTAARIFFVKSALLDDALWGGWGASIAIVTLLVGLVCAVRLCEDAQTYVARRGPDDAVKKLAATQNRPVINEFTIAGPIKEEGRLRPLALRIAFWLVARGAEGIPGFRPGINIPTVATARWIAADGGRRMIFISNYTNAAEPYVRDFIDVEDGAKRINLTFGFGKGYPKTRWIINDGALTNPNGFIYVVTENQRPTAFWYGPYTDMTIDNIKINRAIREGLFANLDRHEAQLWLHLL